jgi:GH24 family phage-related lysozyme (muramidase)
MQPTTETAGFIITEEGTKLRAYRDSRRNWTIGHGHKITDPAILAALDKGGELNISLDFARALLSHDLLKASNEARRIFPHLAEYQPARQTALVSIVYQLGAIDAIGPNFFPRFIERVRAHNWTNAGAELIWTDADVQGLHTPYSIQCPGRAARTAQMIASGQFANQGTPAHEQLA